MSYDYLTDLLISFILYIIVSQKGGAMDYRELKKKADEIKQSQNNRARQNYQYARRLGFTSVESMLLQYRSKDYIDKVAKDRDAQRGA